MKLRTKELSREVDIKAQMQEKSLCESIAGLFKGPAHAFNCRSLDSILHLIERILSNPYYDCYRIVDPIDYKQTVFAVAEALKVLLAIGFESGSSDVFLILPYSKPMTKLVASKRLITGRLETCFKEEHIADKAQLKTLGKFIHSLHTDLTLRTSQKERDLLKLTFDETMKLFTTAGVCKFEEYLLQFVTNPEKFANVLKKVLPVVKAKVLTETLIQAWREAALLRKIASFIRLSFSDPVSRSNLCEKTDLPEIARSVLLMMNIFDAQGMKKVSEGQWRTLYDLMMLYCDRTFLISQGDTEKVKKIDEKVRVGLYQRKVLDAFWANLKSLIVEKVSRQFLSRRPKLTDSQIKNWIYMDLPEIDAGNLEASTLSKMQNIYQLLEMKTTLENQLEQLLYQSNAEQETSEIKEKLTKCADDISNLLWNPRFWLNYGQLFADYKIFTATTVSLNEMKKKMALNMDALYAELYIITEDDKSKSRELMLQELPFYKSGLKSSTLKQLLVSHFGPNPCVTEDIPETTSETKILTYLKKSINFYDEWKLLYLQLSPLNLHAAIMNNHTEMVKDLLDKGFPVNVTDTQQWTALHCACFCGNKEIFDMIMSYKVDINAVDELGQTPAAIAVDRGFFEGTESICSILLNKGGKLPSSHWNKLLMYAATKDDPYYISLAIKTGNFRSVPSGGESAFSLHSCIQKGAKNVLSEIKKSFDPLTFQKILTEVNTEGKTAQELAKEMNNNTEKLVENEIIYMGPMKAQHQKYETKVEEDNECEDNEPIDVYYAEPSAESFY